MGDLVLHINAELNRLCNDQIEEEQSWKKWSIYKVPSVISNLNEKAYQPQLVSFGPYHHHAETLKLMEKHKLRAFKGFLKRSLKSKDEIINSMVEVEQDLKDSYDSLEREWQEDTKEFVKLMIMDGCFMLEILRMADRSFWSEPVYSNDDPIFSLHGELNTIPLIRQDMLLLENQLPMLVLYKLEGIKENDEEGIEKLNKLILNFHGQDRPGGNMGKCLHILDLYRKSLLYGSPKHTEPPNKTKSTIVRSDTESTETEPPNKTKNTIVRSATESTETEPPNKTKNAIVRSATELTEAGIDLERSKSKSLKDITFRHGVLRLPTFIVDDATESTFLNLIAFERCHIGAGHDVTSFISFMNSIVDHDRDISLLSCNKIILNLIGTDEVAANLFNNMSKGLMMGPHSDLDRVKEKIVIYCEKKIPKYRAMLCHTYFKSPWAIISLVAAVNLFALATVSTINSVMGN